MKIKNDIDLNIIVFIALLLSNTTLYAENFRITKPQIWEKITVDQAINELYGSGEFKDGSTTLNVFASCLDVGSCQINIKSTINLETLAVFQDINPKPTVAIFTIHDNSIIDYSFNISTKRLYEDTSFEKDITLIVVGKDMDGKLYKTIQKIVVEFFDP